MTDKPSLKTVMWRLLQARKVVTYDDLQELSGASRSYAKKWMASLVKKGVVKRLPQGRYQVIMSEIPQEPKLKKSSKIKRKKMVRGAYRTKHDEHPEKQLWQAIQQKQSFVVSDLVELEIGDETLIRQYLAVLTRAGYLTKKLTHEVCNQCLYTVARVTGKRAPVIGKTWYVYDPNTDEVWDDIPEKTLHRNK